MKKFLKIFLIFFFGNFVFAQNSNDGNIETSSKKSLGEKGTMFVCFLGMEQSYVFEI